MTDRVSPKNANAMAICLPVNRPENTVVLMGSLGHRASQTMEDPACDCQATDRVAPTDIASIVGIVLVFLLSAYKLWVQRSRHTHKKKILASLTDVVHKGSTKFLQLPYYRFVDAIARVDSSGSGDSVSSSEGEGLGSKKKGGLGVNTNLLVQE